MQHEYKGIIKISLSITLSQQLYVKSKSTEMNYTETYLILMFVFGRNRDQYHDHILSRTNEQFVYNSQ